MGRALYIYYAASDRCGARGAGEGRTAASSAGTRISLTANDRGFGGGGRPPAAAPAPVGAASTTATARHTTPPQPRPRHSTRRRGGRSAGGRGASMGDRLRRRRGEDVSRVYGRDERSAELGSPAPGRSCVVVTLHSLLFAEGRFLTPGAVRSSCCARRYSCSKAGFRDRAPWSEGQMWQFPGGRCRRSCPHKHHKSCTNACMNAYITIFLMYE